MSSPSTSRKRPPLAPADKSDDEINVDSVSDGPTRTSPDRCDDNDDGCDAVNDAHDKKNRMRREIASLHQEMEITGYAKTKSGQRRRKLSRDESRRRTQKRKLLEKVDAQERALEVDNFDPNHDDGKDGGRSRGTKRLRGSRAAIDDEVVHDSLILRARPRRHNIVNEGDDDDQVEDEDEDEERDGNELEDEGDPEPNLEHDTPLDVGNDENASDEEVQAADGDESDAAQEKTDVYQDDAVDGREGRKARSARPPSATKTASLKQRRRMYRLRNFKSFKMAERHGDALAAHARGQPRLAIEKLKAVAKAAPSAPQVYSSLGMVYEDMLNESRKRSNDKAKDSRRDEAWEDRTQREVSASERETDDLPIPASATNTAPGDDAIPDPDLGEQLSLAKKAYGSYHIAAILCKKDFTLWVRAADSGSAIADIHGEIMHLPQLSKELCEYHRSEKQRWQSEVLRDFLIADSLKPPGIDVPAKLAMAHIELGNLSEAFTILTDLKNRTEFRSSYKAWMLYSDLMLRLGHECIQWNRKIHTNENYMVRRWLRKFSKVFDWQERRLQALSLALEAAAGTKNTEQFVSWIRKRAIYGEESSESDPEKAILDAEGYHSRQVPESGVDSTASPPEILPTNVSTKVQLEQEKRLLQAKHTKELDAFDKTTADMVLVPESAPARDRQDARMSLLKSHEAAIDTLVTECNQKDIPTMHAEDQNEIIDMDPELLPVSGSIRQVCLIASELMKHLHGLELCNGARLVGESVSIYLKDRARRHDVTVKSKERAEQWQQLVLQAPMMLGTYDDIDGEESDSDDLPYMSDEDMLVNSGESELLDSLRKGVLPPELRVLYGMALMGQGGRNFVASKCIEAIDHLDQESKLWLSDGEREAELASDSQWFLFRRAMTESLSRTAAYAFCADVLRKTNKEKEWAFQLSTMFRRHLETLKRVGLTDELLRLREGITPNANFRKNQLLKVILAASRFDVDTIDESAAKSFVWCTNDFRLDDAIKVKIACSALASLASIMPLVWTVERDGSLPPVCREIVTVSARFIKWLSGRALQHISYSMLKSILEQITILVSFICGESIPFLGGAPDESMRCLMESPKFPVNASWQPREYRTLSIRSYNLSVGCNITLFSGWENEEFTLKLLKRRYGNRHFGVHIRDRRIAGCLPSAIEEELMRQWSRLAELEPAFPVLNIGEKFFHVKRSDWYIKETKARDEAGTRVPIANYGENEALEILLGFSALCLHQAASETDKTISNQCHQLALSVLLPTSQFCLDEQLWDSDIGEAATLLSSYDEWRLMAGSTKHERVLDTVSDTVLDTVPEIVPDTISDIGQEKAPSRPRRVKRAERILDQKVKEWIDGSDASHRTFIAIPTIEMTRLWKQARSSQNHRENEATESLAMETMQRIQKITQDLRACFSIAATEKSCLNLSASLLVVAGLQSCYDPFSCLQLATMSASFGPKSGSSDITFQRALPEMSMCTPLEALTILGRADCLNAVYFPNEAAYLCSYVARVCRLHRKEEGTLLEWNDEWKIIAIYAYNVSVMIRTSVSTILDDQLKKSFMAAWSREVVEELERGRKDGIAWKRQLTPQITETGNSQLGYDSDDSSAAKDPPDSKGIANSEPIDIEDDSDEDLDTTMSKRLDNTSTHNSDDGNYSKNNSVSPSGTSDDPPQSSCFDPEDPSLRVAKLLETTLVGTNTVDDNGNNNNDDEVAIYAI